MQNFAKLCPRHEKNSFLDYHRGSRQDSLLKNCRKQSYSASVLLGCVPSQRFRCKVLFQCFLCYLTNDQKCLILSLSAKNLPSLRGNNSPTGIEHMNSLCTQGRRRNTPKFFEGWDCSLLIRYPGTNPEIRGVPSTSR